ncbi:hypothetical protein VIBNISO65_830024 [Vibrio nigripulchritudo SO65]|nr:hypothetical protein VIBNIAM115_840024 [Vibrio nigripulchritudo AM115]CCN42690.1 hypothetical protein VIBNIFTn2_360024 [Vibrio nigripulchritudo FTn2]CCN79086.1 hypothetical protein VIBNISO65_830024 [Vibrio nigripulchritudo SO65]
MRAHGLEQPNLTLCITFSFDPHMDVTIDQIKDERFRYALHIKENQKC